MYILLMNKQNQHEIMHVQMIPRVGDKIDRFNTPMPQVKEVALFPSNSTVEKIYNSLGVNGVNTFSIDAIVAVE